MQKREDETQTAFTLRLVRAEAIEQAAQVAERRYPQDSGMHPMQKATAQAIASAIREYGGLTEDMSVSETEKS